MGGRLQICVCGCGFSSGSIMESWHAVGVWGNTLVPPVHGSECCFGFVCGVGVVVENCIVDASIFGLFL